MLEYFSPLITSVGVEVTSSALGILADTSHQRLARASLSVRQASSWPLRQPRDLADLAQASAIPTGSCPSPIQSRCWS
jgi:hypothetical protein